MTIREFIDKHNIRVNSDNIGGRPDTPPSEQDRWYREASHYAVTIRCPQKGTEYTTLYSMGSALKGAPKASDIMDSLRSDASSADCGFEAWCAERGHDPDSRKAFQEFEACERTAQALRELLGREEFKELMECESE